MITRVVCRVDAYGITFHLASWSSRIISSTGAEGAHQCPRLACYLLEA